MLTYAGEGKILVTTAVKLKVNRNMLKLHAIEAEPAFSFPSPDRWKAYTGERITSHSGKISILLGGDNHKVFPVEVERDLWSVVLYRSKLSQNHLIYGPVDAEIITWSDPEDEAYINSVCVKSLSLLKLQDQLLLTISADRFSDPTTREKLAQITKKKAIKEILANTPVDKSNN